MCYERISTQRGGEILIIDGIMHTKHDKKEAVEIWRCKNRLCSGRVYLKEDQIMNFIPHNTIHDPKEIQTLKFNSQLKNVARSTRDRPITILADHFKNMTDNELSVLIKTDSLKKIISREREKIFNFNVNNFDDIPEVLKRDVRGDIFLHYDSGQADNNRIVVFASKWKIENIEKCKIFIIDGTFSSVPGNFYQLVTVHTVILGSSFPMFYILCKNKKQATYVRSLEFLKDQFSMLPSTFITDFELGLSNAVSKLFPNSQIFYCHFHFCQNLWRRLHQYNLTRRYFFDVEFKKVFKMVISLAFLPYERMNEGYDFILEKIQMIDNNKPLLDFINEFSNSYFFNFDYRNGTDKSKFSPFNWNVFYRTINKLPRTTNCLESWHNTLRIMCGISHPNIAHFVSKLIEKEEIDRKIFLELIKFGPVLTRKELEKEEGLRVLCENHSFYSIKEFFERIQHLFTK